MGKFFEHMDFITQMEFPFQNSSFHNHNDYDNNDIDEFEDLFDDYPQLPQQKFKEDKVLKIQKNLRRISGEFDFNYDLPSELEVSKKERPPLSRVSSTGSISNYVYRPVLPRSFSSTQAENRTQVQDDMLLRYEARQKQFEDAVERRKCKEERKKSFSGLRNISGKSITEFTRSLSGSLTEFAKTLSDFDPQPQLNPDLVPTKSATSAESATSDENSSIEVLSANLTPLSSVTSSSTPKLSSAPIKKECNNKTTRTETSSNIKPPPLPPKNEESSSVKDIPEPEVTPLTTTRSRRLGLSNVGKKMRRKSFSDFGKSIAKKVVAFTTLETTPYNSDDEVFDEDKGADLPEVEIQLIHNSIVPVHKRKKIQLPTLDPSVPNNLNNLNNSNNSNNSNDYTQDLSNVSLIDIPPPCKLQRHPSSELRLINQANPNPNPSLLSASTISKYSLSSTLTSTVPSKSLAFNSTLDSSTSALSSTPRLLPSFNPPKPEGSTLDPKARLELMKKQKQKHNQLIQNSTSNLKKETHTSSNSLALVSKTPNPANFNAVDPNKLYYIPPLNPTYQPRVPMSVRTGAIKYDFARLSPIPSVSTDQSSIKSFTLLDSIASIKEISETNSIITKGGKTSASPLPQLPFDVLIAQSTARKLIPKSSSSSTSTIKSSSSKKSSVSNNNITSSSTSSSSKSSISSYNNISSENSNHHSSSTSSPSVNEIADMRSSTSLSYESSSYQKLKSLPLYSDLPGLSSSPSLSPSTASSLVPMSPPDIESQKQQQQQQQQTVISYDPSTSRLNSLSVKRRPPPSTNSLSREVSSYSCSSFTAPSSRISSAVTVLRHPPPESDVSPVSSTGRSLPLPATRIASSTSTLMPETPTALNSSRTPTFGSTLADDDYSYEFLDIYSGFGDIEENDNIEVIHNTKSKSPGSQKQFDVQDLLEKYNILEPASTSSYTSYSNFNDNNYNTNQAVVTRSSSLKRKPPPPAKDYLSQPNSTHSNSITGSVVCHIIGCYSENNYDDPLLKEDEDDDVSLVVEFGRSIPRIDSPVKSNKSENSSSLFSYRESDTHSTDARTSIGSEYIGNFASGSNSSILSSGDLLQDDSIPLVTTKFNSSKSIPGLSYQQINTLQMPTTVGFVSVPTTLLSDQQKNELYEMRQRYSDRHQKELIDDSIYDMYSNLSRDEIETDSSKETISSTKKFLQSQRSRSKLTKKKSLSKHIYSVDLSSGKDIEKYGYCNGKNFDAVEHDLETKRRSRLKFDDIESDLEDKRQERLQRLQQEREEQEEIELLELEIAKRKNHLKMRLAEQNRENHSKIELLEMTKRQLSAVENTKPQHSKSRFGYENDVSTNDDSEIQIDRVRSARKRLSEGIRARKSVCFEQDSCSNESARRKTTYLEPTTTSTEITRRKSTRRKLAEKRHRTVSMEYLKRVGIQPGMLTGYQTSLSNTSSDE